jgi:hypothetical protein
MKPSPFSTILSAASLLFAVLGPKFFHSTHGQATMAEIEMALMGAAMTSAQDQAPPEPPKAA